MDCFLVSFVNLDSDYGSGHLSEGLFQLEKYCVLSETFFHLFLLDIPESQALVTFYLMHLEQS